MTPYSLKWAGGSHLPTPYLQLHLTRNQHSLGDERIVGSEDISAVSHNIVFVNSAHIFSNSVCSAPEVESLLMVLNDVICGACSGNESWDWNEWVFGIWRKTTLAYWGGIRIVVDMDHHGVLHISSALFISRNTVSSSSPRPFGSCMRWIRWFALTRSFVRKFIQIISTRCLRNSRNVRGKFLLPMFVWHREKLAGVTCAHGKFQFDWFG